jgi:hypothetical protein
VNPPLLVNRSARPPDGVAAVATTGATPAWTTPFRPWPDWSFHVLTGVPLVAGASLARSHRTLPGRDAGVNGPLVACHVNVAVADRFCAAGVLCTCVVNR